MVFFLLVTLSTLVNAQMNISAIGNDTTNLDLIDFPSNKFIERVVSDVILCRYTIIATAGPNGSICPSGVTTVNYGMSQNYSITPAIGYRVLDVLVDGVSVGAVTCYKFVKVKANHTISASFAPYATFTITATSGPNGSVTPAGVTTVSSCGSQSYAITPATGYHVFDVLVDGVSVGAVTSYKFINVKANHTISASFAPNATFTITATSGPNGSVTPAGVTTVSSCGSQIYAITPAIGYHVVDVLVDGVSVGAVTSYTFINVNANHTISASFSADITNYTLTVIATNGTVAKNPDQASYNSGTVVQLTAAPAMGYHFTGWSGDLTGSTNPVNVTMDGNKTITANFAINTYTFTVHAVNGTVTLNPPTGPYEHGTTDADSGGGVSFRKLEWRYSSRTRDEHSVVGDDGWEQDYYGKLCDQHVHVHGACGQWDSEFESTNGSVQSRYDSDADADSGDGVSLRQLEWRCPSRTRDE
jgi:uncharacterized repeat protein (TIGR02543 family)